MEATTTRTVPEVQIASQLIKNAIYVLSQAANAAEALELTGESVCLSEALGLLAEARSRVTERLTWASVHPEFLGPNGEGI